MKIVRSGDILEITENSIRHSFKVADISRVSYLEATGTTVIDVSGQVFRVRLMECQGIRAKTSEQLYNKMVKIMGRRGIL